MTVFLFGIVVISLLSAGHEAMGMSKRFFDPLYCASRPKQMSDGHSYILVAGAACAATWSQARQKCYENGYYLANIDSEAELTEVKDWLDSMDDNGPLTNEAQLFVDATEEGHKHCWVRASGPGVRRVSDTFPWYTGKPNNLDARNNYAALVQDKGWGLLDVADEPSGYLCERTPNEAPSPLPSMDVVRDPRVCARGCSGVKQYSAIQYEDGRQYVLVLDKKDWWAARQQCYDCGFFLANIQHEQEVELAWLFQATEDRDVPRVWVDGTDAGHPNCWFQSYPEAGPVSRHFPWYQGQRPTNPTGTELYAGLVKKLGWGLIGMEDSPSAFLCQKNPGEVQVDLPEKKDVTTANYEYDCHNLG